MSNLQSVEIKRGGRQPLLLYQRLNEQVFWPSILIMITCAVLLIWTPDELQANRSYLATILFGTGLLLILTFIFRLRAYVQCRDKGLWIQLPLYRLSIPYEDIQATRPNDYYRIFPPKKVPRIQRSFLRPLLGKTVVLLDMQELPRPKPVLRLWVSRYMINPDEFGLVLPVRDWIALRTELDDFRSRKRQYHY